MGCLWALPFYRWENRVLGRYCHLHAFHSHWTLELESEPRKSGSSDQGDIVNMTKSNVAGDEGDWSTPLQNNTVCETNPCQGPLHQPCWWLLVHCSQEGLHRPAETAWPWPERAWHLTPASTFPPGSLVRVLCPKFLWQSSLLYESCGTW